MYASRKPGFLGLFCLLVYLQCIEHGESKNHLGLQPIFSEPSTEICQALTQMLRYNSEQEPQIPVLMELTFLVMNISQWGRGPVISVGQSVVLIFHNRHRYIENIQIVSPLVVNCLVAKSCLSLLQSHGLQPARIQFMGFPRQKYWSGLPNPTPWDLPTHGSNLCLLHWQADYLPLSQQRIPSLLVNSDYIIPISRILPDDRKFNPEVILLSDLCNMTFSSSFQILLGYQPHFPTMLNT